MMDLHDPDTLARERRLDALLAEAAGDGVPEDLQARVLERLHAFAPVAHAPGTARRPRPAASLAAALLVAGGIAVVVGTRMLDRDDGAAAAAQDPVRIGRDPVSPPMHVVEVADAAVRAALGKPVSIAAGAAAVDELLRLAGERSVPVVVRSGRSATLPDAIEGASVQAAIGRLAATLGAGVEEVDGVFVVRREAAGLPFAATFSSSATMDVRGFVRALSASTGARIVLADDVRGRVVCDLHDAPWRAALELVATGIGAEVVGCGSVLLVRRRTAPAHTPRVAVAFDGMPLPRVAAALAKLGRLNVVLAPGLDAGLSLRIRDVDAEHVLRAAARAAGAELLVEDRGILQLVAAPADPARPIDVLAEDAELRTTAELLRSASGVDVAVSDGAGKRFSVFARGGRLADLARALALATGRTVVRQPDGSLRIE